MPQDVAQLVERYLSEDPIRWGRLASDIQWRRLQLLLLREILLELRGLRGKIELGTDTLKPRHIPAGDGE
jgi:hypothetical protein